MAKPPQKVRKIMAKFALEAWKVNMMINKKREFISPDHEPLQHLR